MRTPLLAAAFLFGLLLVAPGAEAGEGVPAWCEVHVDLQPGGRASIEYTVAYRHRAGTFHGFYFTGDQIDRLAPIWDDAWGRATLEDGRQVAIRRGFRGGKKTIELAGGRGVTHGQVIFRFRFATDLARAGFLARTTDGEGRKLIVLNWAPSTWDHALEHYTVWVRYPVQAPARPREGTFLDGIHFRTEPFMNERYLIDYLRGDEGRFEVQLHWKNVPRDTAMRVQQYVDASLFDGSFHAISRRELERDQVDLPLAPRWILLIVGLLGGVLFLGLVRLKHGDVRAARDARDEVTWTAVDWVPPKIELSTFRKPGKVCKTLSPVEVAFFLELPYKQILSTMLQRLTKAGFLEIVRENPLRVRTLAREAYDASQLEPYEWEMVMAALDDGRFSEAELEKLLELVVANVQKKAWDCDIEATKAYLRKQIEAVWKLREADGYAGPDEDARRPFGERTQGWYHWYFHRYGYDDYDRSLEPAKFERAIDVNVDHVSYDEFLAQPEGLVDACHSACHSAWHSARP